MRKGYRKRTLSGTKRRKHLRRTKKQAGGRSSNSIPASQAGGSLDTLKNHGKVIENEIQKINSTTDNLKGRTEDMMRSLDEICMKAAAEGKLPETEKEIRNYMELLLKDDKNLRTIFPKGTKPVAEHREFLDLLAKYAELRNDTDTLIKFIYRYINLRFSYPAGSVGGPTQNGPGWNGSSNAGNNPTNPNTNNPFIVKKNNATSNNGGLVLTRQNNAPIVLA